MLKKKNHGRGNQNNPSRFHGFNLLLIALLALRGHSPHCRAGQGGCRLHLYNSHNSLQDYQRRYGQILCTAEAITLSRPTDPCNMSNVIIALCCSHLAALVCAIGVWAHIYVCWLLPNRNLFLFLTHFSLTRERSMVQDKSPLELSGRPSGQKKTTAKLTCGAIHCGDALQTRQSSLFKLLISKELRQFYISFYF